jgi:pimeloyl-ACP methyl ester carboxylesterase
MGAKVAMTLSCKHPDRISSLISLDTAPLSFANNDTAIKQTIDHLNQIKGLDIQGKSRKGAIEVVEK